MRITKILVTDLFGLFDHEIPLNTEEHATIIHSPNGYGKTAMLTMINALFAGAYKPLRRIPFRELSVHFDNAALIRVTKDKKNGSDVRVPDGNDVDLAFAFQEKPGSKVQRHVVKHLRGEEVHFPLGMIEHAIPDLNRVGADEWHFGPTGEILSLDEVLERFGPRLNLPSSLYGELLKGKGVPGWLDEIQKAVNVRFIETQRLLRFQSSREPNEYSSRGRSTMLPTSSVQTYSEELATAIQQKLAEYATLSQSLDRTFPTRLVKATSVSSIEQLRSSLRDLETKRAQLITAGFLDKEKEVDFEELQKIDENNRNVLSVYIEDVKEKLGVFNELTTKIDLLVNIINSRFLFKKMSIGKKEGFVFTTPDNKSLSPASLSSGEHHELVLMYELLFKVSENSLLLIDEPELSLHVGWQQQFLKDMLNIIKLTGFDVLIATHSPQIIHDRWDLTVELKGRE